MEARWGARSAGRPAGGGPGPVGADGGGAVTPDGVAGLGSWGWAPWPTPEALQPRVLLWPLLFGLGLYLLLTAQPLGRPKPDLAERLRRLDVDERIRAQVTRRDGRPIFVSRTLELLLRPVLDDGGGRCSLLGRFGLGGGAVLERKLRLARPGIEPSQFFGEKVARRADRAGALPADERPGDPALRPLAGVAVGGRLRAGFLAPDWQLEPRLARGARWR